MALPFRIAKRAVSRLSSLRNFIKRTNTAVADIYRNGFFDNASPSVALNSPADAGTTSDTTPTLDFTGTDAEGNDIRYEVQIDMRNDFVEDISIGNMSNGGVIASQSSETFSHNNNGEDVIVLVALRDTETADTVTGVTYGGEAMTQDKAVLLEDDDSGADLRVYVYRKQGALTGANNVVVSFSGSVDHGAAFAVSLSGLAQSGQPDATASDSDLTYGQDPDGAITTVATKTIVFDVLYHKGDNLVVGGGQTEIGNLSPNGSGDKVAASYKIVSSAGSQSMNWSASSNDDWLQALVSYEARSILLKKVSGTDSGFANPDNGGDTDPFNSGENIQYTVQAGDALAVGTYYWRVRAIDPSGSNSYGAWSSIRSFEVTSGGSIQYKTLSATFSGATTFTKRNLMKRALSAALSAVQTLTKKSSRKKTLSSTAAFSGALAKVSKRFKTLSASITASAAIIASRKIFKALSSSLSQSATLTKRKYRSIALSASATASVSVALLKKFKRALSVASTGVATIAIKKMLFKAIGAGIAMASSIIASKKYFVGKGISISNPSFESGTIGGLPDDWDEFNSVGDPIKELVADSYEGGKAFRIYSATDLIDGGIRTTTTKRFALKNGMSYRCRFWYKTTADVSNATVVVRRLAGTSVQGSVHYSGATNGWTRGAFSFTYSGSAGDLCEILVGLGAYGSTSKGEFIVDGVSIDEDRLFALINASASVAVKKTIKKALSTVVALSQSITTFKSRVRTLTGAFSGVGSLSRRSMRKRTLQVAETMSASVSKSKRIVKLLVAAVSAISTMALGRSLKKTLSISGTFVVLLGKVKKQTKSLSASISIAVTLIALLIGGKIYERISGVYSAIKGKFSRKESPYSAKKGKYGKSDSPYSNMQ